MSTAPHADVRNAGTHLPLPADRWDGRREFRADLRAALQLAFGLAVAGIPAGLAWWALAPRADFRITEDGPAVIGSPSSELLVADDAVFVLVLAVVGLLAGLAAWLLRRHRGVVLVVALAVGATASGAVAWLVGDLLGGGPSKEELATVGGVVTTGLHLNATAALAVAPFVAVLGYLLCVITNADDGLSRDDASPAPSGGSA